MLDKLIGELVVIDMRSTFVCIGKLHAVDDAYLDVRHADLHDLRDTQTTRELYISDSRNTGIKRNRKRVLLMRSDVVAVSRLADVVEK